MGHSKSARPLHFCQCGDHAWVVLTKGYVALISPEDAKVADGQKWRAVGKGNTVYATADTGSLHRKILQITSQLGDHINGNGLDNRRPNLRPATYQQNAQNGVAHNDSTSKFRGVSWYRNYQKWRAAIYVSGKQKCLGYFETELEAAHIYDRAAVKHFGEFARLNLPPAASTPSPVARDSSPSASLAFSRACAARGSC